jgi:C-terminal processing protease CtpA/Prc
LIIDLRGNGGGNEQVLMDGVLRYLVSEPVEIGVLRVSNCGSLSRFMRGWELGAVETAQDGGLPSNALTEELNRRFPAVFADSAVLTPQEERFLGKAWLLVDGAVYSAADGFAAKCKAANLATLVGSRTKGGGMSSQPIPFSLPNSGILVFFEDVVAINDDGTCSAFLGTLPDVEMKGEDALDHCLRLIAEGFEG